MNVRRNACRMLAGSLALSVVLSCAPSFASEVSGIWTDNTTTDVGKLSGIKALEGLKTRGWVSTYYNYKLGNASNQSAITGRTYDIRNESFELNEAELEVEKVPQAGGVGFKVDMAGGDVMDQNVANISAANGSGSQSTFDHYIQHATVGYLANIGKGLRIDMGKMVTHIGQETIEDIKNDNFSHSYEFTYAIPTYETGVRLNYPWNDNITTELYLTNDWNSTIASNKGKQVSPSVDWTWGAWSGVVNYQAGLVSDGYSIADPSGINYNGAATVGGRSTMRQLFDTQINYAWKNLTMAVSIDYGTQNGLAFNNGIAANSGLAYKAACPAGGSVCAGDTRTVTWWGHAWYAHYKLSDTMEPAIRIESYADPEGYTTAQNGTVYAGGKANQHTAQDLAFRPGATRFMEYTFTWNQKVASHLMVRPEIRWDKANRRTTLFTNNHGQSISSQATIGLNAIYYF